MKPDRRSILSVLRDAFEQFISIGWITLILVLFLTMAVATVGAEVFNPTTTTLYVPPEYEYVGTIAPPVFDEAVDPPVRSSPPTTRRWQGNQYGCHDDGRCLDEYDHWCEEVDQVWLEEIGEYVCPETYENW